jgi:hypothetical protein
MLAVDGDGLSRSNVAAWRPVIVIGENFKVFGAGKASFQVIGLCSLRIM